MLASLGVAALVQWHTPLQPTACAQRQIRQWLHTRPLLHLVPAVPQIPAITGLHPWSTLLQLGETLLGLLEHAQADVATAYKMPGLSLRDLCDQLVSTGLAERRAVGKAIHLLPRPHWLQPYVRAARSASPPRRAMPARPQPQAALGPRAAGAGAANTAPRRAAGGAEGAVEVVLHPLPSSKKGGISRGNAVMLLSVAAYRLIAGARLVTSSDPSF